MATAVEPAVPAIVTVASPMITAVVMMIVVVMLLFSATGQRVDRACIVCSVLAWLA
jgi:hypothetical protein